MRHLFVIVFAALILSSCGDGDLENGNTGSDYIVINEINQRANISLYNSKTKKLTKQLFTDDSEFYSRVNGAAQDGDFIYLNTWKGDGSTLWKIDISTGTAIEDTDTWVVSRAFLNTANNQVIMAYLDTSNGDEQRTCVEIFDQNLVRLDSVVVEENTMELDATTTVKNKLFYSVVIENEGAFIKIFDLNSRSVIRSIERSNRCIRLQPIDDTRILAIEYGKTEIIDASTLEVVSTIPGMNSDYAAEIGPSTDILYYLKPVPQPALIASQLWKVKVSTNTHTQLSDDNENIIAPLTYNRNDKTIASGGGLKLLDENGKVVDRVEDLPHKPLYIFVR